MELPAAMAHLLRILWLAAAVFHGAALAAFDGHLSNYEEQGYSVFNASLGSGWSYALHPSLTGEDAKENIEIDSNSGELSLSKVMECDLLHENPFLVYVQTRGRTTDTGSEKVGSYVMIPIAISVHGIGCHPKKAKKKNFDRDNIEHTPLSATRPLQIMMEYPEGTCWFPGDVLLNLNNFLPKSLSGCPISYMLSDGKEHDFDLDAMSGKLRTEKDVVCVFEHQSEHISGSVQIPSSCLAKPPSYLSDKDEEVPILIELRASDTNRLNADFSDDTSVNGEVVLKRFRRQLRNTYPTFSQPIYTRLIPENKNAGFVVATITATDNDDGDNGRLSYSLVALGDARSQNMFAVEENTGIITTTTSLDREQIQSHSFRLTATDHGTPPKSAQVYLTVNVDDRNDHTPVFEQPSYVETTNEGQNPGTLIVRVRASDNDDGLNAEIRYSIVNNESPNDVFTMNPTSGEIKTLVRLDREQTERYNILVMAQDMGTDPRKRNSTAEVLLTVLDLNDNSPHFSQLSYEVSVREDVSPGDPESQILHIMATDADEGSNADVHFSLTHGNFENRFRIDSVNGFISLQNSLDFENTRNYRLSIRAQDSGNPPRENTTTVTVTVVDVNDNSPQFTQNVYQGIVREDVDVGYSILSVMARDDDELENARITFSIPNPPNDFPFEINPTSGAITNSVSLDRESGHSWEFNVIAVDHGETPNSSTASVTITVTDVNDNAPTFPEEVYHAAVAENAYHGFEVITVTATDPDEQNTISYRIVDALDPTGRIPFNILTQNNEGTITVTSQLSYNSKSFYALTVTASDRQFESTCTVYVNVTDVNDFAPVFQNSPYNVYVSEGADIGEVIVTVSAADNDAGANAEVSYSMDPSPEFEINEESGEIVTKVLLDREEISSYTLYVTASDHGINPQQSRAFVQVTVQDINDNAPVFEETSFTAEIQENSPAYSSVITMSASDADQGLY